MNYYSELNHSEYHFAECYSVECFLINVIMICVFVLSVVVENFDTVNVFILRVRFVHLSVAMESDFLLSGIKLNDKMLSVLCEFQFQ
jgi:hypothetical protein